MSGLVHQIGSGLAIGFIYASLALALVMIFQSTGHINFAQGEMAMFSTYIAWAGTQSGIPFWMAFVVAVSLSFVLGFLVELVVLRRFANAPVFTVVIVIIALFLILNSVAGWIFGYEMHTFPSPFPSTWAIGFLSAQEVGVAIVTLLVLIQVFIFFRFTRWGLAMRAVAQNPISSRLVGLNVGLALAIGWGLSAMIGAVAGIMAAPIVFVDPNMMGGIMIYAFAAALLGGINNPLGAVVGGLTVGVLENLVGTYIVGTELKLSLALMLILGVLLIRPYGLFGTAPASRV